MYILFVTFEQTCSRFRYKILREFRCTAAGWLAGWLTGLPALLAYVDFVFFFIFPLVRMLFTRFGIAVAATVVAVFSHRRRHRHCTAFHRRSRRRRRIRMLFLAFRF